MISARLLTVLAASSLAGIAYAQTQPAPSSQPNAAPGYNASKPHQREMKSAPGNEQESPSSRPAPGAALTTSKTGSMASAKSKTAPGSSLATPQSSSGEDAEATRTAKGGPAGHSWPNMPVESPSGESLGSVSNVVPGLNGRQSSGYVMVSGANGMSVPVPYRVANLMVRNGKLVLSQSRLEHAPKVTQEDLQNQSDRGWRVKADRYWEHGGHGHMRR